MASRKRTYAELVQEIEDVKGDLKAYLGAEVSVAKLQAIDKELEDVKLMLEEKRPFDLRVIRTEDVPVATGTSHLNVHTYQTTLSDKNEPNNVEPEAWQISWHTGRYRGLVVEYHDPAGTLQSGLTTITDFAEQLEPVLGNGGVDQNGNLLEFGKTLGVVDLAQGIIRDYDGDLNIPGRSRSLTFDENGNSSSLTFLDPYGNYCHYIDRGTLHDNKWFQVKSVWERYIPSDTPTGQSERWLVVKFECIEAKDPADAGVLSKWMKFKKTMFHCAKFCYDVYTMDIWDTRSVEVKFTTRRPKHIEDYLLKVAMSSYADREFNVLKSE
jgi:hypothetical protein